MIGRRGLLGAGLATALLAPLPARATEIQRVVSPGGIVAWLVRDTTLPLLALQFRFRGGSAAAPVDRPGIAGFAVDMLEEGAGARDATGFARARADHSIALDIDIGADWIAGGLRVLDTHRALGVDLLREMLARPRFDDDACERVRARLIAGLRRESEEPRAMLRRAFGARAWRGHPYAPARIDAELAAIGTATVAELRGFLAGRLARDALVVGAVGNIAAEALGGLLDEAFGALPALAAPDTVPEARPALEPARTLVIRRPLPQSLVLAGAPGIKRDDPDWFAGQMVNYVLGGGGFNSRLMTELRERRGLTYGVGTSVAAQDRGALVVGSFSTENARAAEALALLRAEWRRIGETGPSATELENAKAYLTGSFPLALDSSAAVARLLVTLQYEGLGIGYLAQRDALIRAVDADAARRAAARLFGGPGPFAMLVGAPAAIDGAELLDTP